MKNPLGTDNKPMKCFKCKCSCVTNCTCPCVYHFANKCTKSKPTSTLALENLP